MFENSSQGGRASPRAQIFRESGRSWGSRERSPHGHLPNASQTELEAVAKGWEKMKPFLEGKTVKQVIVLPKKPGILLAG